MTEGVFLDTNVLVYAHTLGDRRTPLAQRLLYDGGRINVQVLNEFAWVVRSKLNFSWADVSLAVDKILILCPNPTPLTLDIHLRSIELSRMHKFSTWDSLIVSAALEASCKVLYTEDLQHGQVIDGLRIENPFLP